MFARGIFTNKKYKYTIMGQGNLFVLRNSVLIKTGLDVFTGT